MKEYFYAISLLLETLSKANIKYVIDDEFVVSFREGDLQKVAPTAEHSEFVLNTQAYKFTLSNKRVFVKPIW